jgi:uncharacterized protein
MKTALITGASGGIGKAFAEELASQKMNLVLVARSEDRLNQLAAELQERYPIQVDVIVKDLTETTAVQSIFDLTHSKGIQIDVLINNAGFGDYGTFAQSNGDRQVKMVQLNVLALVDLTHKYLPLMQQNLSGTIINIASIAAFQPVPYLSVYAATKAFVLNFSEALWAETRPYGVKVLAVCPGPTETNFFHEAKFPDALTGKSPKVITSEEVVKETMKALNSGDISVVTGGLLSHFIGNLSKFIPRKTMLELLQKQFSNG